jgi:hypothetical protein
MLKFENPCFFKSLFRFFYFLILRFYAQMAILFLFFPSLWCGGDGLGLGVEGSTLVIPKYWCLDTMITQSVNSLGLKVACEPPQRVLGGKQSCLTLEKQCY